MTVEAKPIVPGELVDVAAPPKPPKPMPGPGQRLILVRGAKGRMERRIVPVETADQVSQAIQVDQVDQVDQAPPGELLEKPGPVQVKAPWPDVKPADQVPPGGLQADPGAVHQVSPGGTSQAPPDASPGPATIPPGGAAAPGDGKAPDFSAFKGGSPGPDQPGSPGGPPGAAPPPNDQSQLVDYPAVAGMTFDMLTNILASIFGPEWRPENAEERTMVTMSLAAYMKSKNMPDIPPGLMLVLVCAIYSAKRFQAPPTKAKIKLIFGWLKLKLGRFFRRRAPMAVPPFLEPVASEA
jgi:hypothetical protein